MFSSKKSSDVDMSGLLTSACVFALSLHPERNPFQLQYEMDINSPIHDFNGWLTAAHHQKVPIWGYLVAVLHQSYDS
jgi:hypothetical protein